MAIRKVARLGHPVLRQPAVPVEIGDIARPEIQRLIDDMIETMHEYDGVGLAAPQVHVSRQIAVLEVEANPRYPSAPAVPLTVLINPRIALMGETEEDWEGCLSIPDLRGPVPRAARVEVEALGRHGSPVRIVAEGFHARVLQHECDHLLGRVYLDRMPSLERLAHSAEFERFWVQSRRSG